MGTTNLLRIERNSNRLYKIRVKEVPPRASPPNLDPHYYFCRRKTSYEYENSNPTTKIIIRNLDVNNIYCFKQLTGVFQCVKPK